MVSFESDYTTGAHAQILKKLAETNLEPLTGYGADKYCDSAKEKIKKACGLAEAEVEFLVGGTQANAVVISTLLRDYEGVIAADTGHINVHESGAVEYTGHKVLALPHNNGKINPEALKAFMESFYSADNCEHTVYPGMIYISYPTEYGTLYSKNELTRISEIAHKYSMPLFIDGARLGYGLMSNRSDLALSDIAALADVFYIGGTKVGALCGEAVVFTHNNKPAHFTHSIKKRGALLAKGRLLGIQFDTLFTDDLYFEISRHTIAMAEEMKKIFLENKCSFFIDSPTNQQFIILENSMLEKLKDYVIFSIWEKYDETHTVVRFVTSWSTSQADLDELRGAFKAANI